MNNNVELAKQNLEFMLNWIGRFDNKASVILGLNLGMLSLLATMAPTFDKWNNWMWGSSLLTLLALGSSFICIYFSNYPRTSSPELSLYYFGTIAECEIEDYCINFTSRNEADHITDLLKQTHRNAEILKTKFEFLKGAYVLLFIGVIPWLVSLFLFNNVV